MKTLHTVTETTQFPQFWNEEWLEKAIREVDTRAMSPEQKLSYEMAISANVLALKNENKKIEEAKLKEKEIFVISLLEQTDFDIEKISIIAGVSVEFARSVEKKHRNRI